MSDEHSTARGTPVYGLPRGRSGGGRETAGTGPIDWFATLSQARGRPRTTADIRHRPLQERSGQLLLIALDCSGSTLKDQRLSATKGALGSLLEMAYLQRSRIAILEFAGQGARLSVPPQRAPKQHADMIDTIAGGGGTPLRQGLEEAIQLLERERKRLPQEQQTLVLFTDGRSRDAIDDLRVPCRTLVIDTESGPLRLGRCRQLANTMNGEYLTLDNLPVKRYDA